MHHLHPQRKPRRLVRDEVPLDRKARRLLKEFDSLLDGYQGEPDHRLADTCDTLLRAAELLDETRGYAADVLPGILRDERRGKLL